MSILLDIFVLIFGCLIFLFFFWRRLKEDYSGELIFSSGLIIVFSILLGLGSSRIISGFVKSSPVFISSEIWLWGCFLGFLIGFIIAVRKFKLRAVEAFEAAVLGLLSWLLLVYLSNLSLVFIITTGLVLLLFYYFEGRYRRYHWYKSGRVGFSGLAAAGIYFVVRMLLSILVPGLFSVVGKLDLVLSGVSAFLLFFSLYNLSESN